MGYNLSSLDVAWLQRQLAEFFNIAGVGVVIVTFFGIALGGSLFKAVRSLFR